jgi:hypothetical protein
MPRFEEAGHTDDAALAHPMNEARARSFAPTPTPFRSAAIPDWRAGASGDVHRAERPTARVDPDEVWDRLGDFA